MYVNYDETTFQEKIEWNLEKNYEMVKILTVTSLIFEKNFIILVILFYYDNLPSNVNICFVKEVYIFQSIVNEYYMYFNLQILSTCTH